MQNFGSLTLLSNFGGPKKRDCAIIRRVRRVLSLEIARDYHTLMKSTNTDILAKAVFWMRLGPARALLLRVM